MYLLESLLVCLGFIMVVFFGVSLIEQYNTYGNMSSSLFISEMSLIFILCVSIFGIPKIGAKSSTWKFKNYEDVEKFLVSEYPNLEFSQEDKERLVKLIFFGWEIENSSTSGNIILTRKWLNKEEEIIFHKK